MALWTTPYLILAKLANPKNKVQNGRSERNGALFIDSSFWSCTRGVPQEEVLLTARIFAVVSLRESYCNFIFSWPLESHVISSLAHPKECQAERRKALLPLC